MTGLRDRIKRAPWFGGANPWVVQLNVDVERALRDYKDRIRIVTRFTWCSLMRQSIAYGRKYADLSAELGMGQEPRRS